MYPFFSILVVYMYMGYIIIIVITIGVIHSIYMYIGIVFWHCTLQDSQGDQPLGGETFPV